jgi:hypothetical protein
MSITICLAALALSNKSLCILSKASNVPSMVLACLLRSALTLTAIDPASLDKVIDSNGESAGTPVIAVRAEHFPSLGNMAEFRIICSNGNKLGHSRNGILNSEHGTRKSWSISRLTASTVP